MSTEKPHDSIPHEDRTAAEPRENTIEPVTISHIRDINPTTRVLRLSPKDPNHIIKFLPGQWLDTYIPTLPKAGGFTITSPPHLANPQANTNTNTTGPAHLELAIQKSPNPPALYLHQPASALLHTPLKVRVGGSFTWPPPSIPTERIKRLVLIAGGVGINPLISIFAHLIRGLKVEERPEEIHFLYGTKGQLRAEEVLFLPRLVELLGEAEGQGKEGRVSVSVFLTGAGGGRQDGGDGRDCVVREGFPERTWERRMERGDLVGALDGWGRRGERVGRGQTVCYVCGPQKMTDEIVEFLGEQEGMERERVLCEKWW